MPLINLTDDRNMPIKGYGKNHVHFADGNKHKLVIGGAVNAKPFDGGDEYAPQHVKHSQTQGRDEGWVRHLNHGMGVDVHLIKGACRIYPVRGERGKYIEIFDPVPPDAFQVEQVNDQCVDYWIQYEGWKLTIRLNDIYMKVLIEVDDSYTGDGIFDLGFKAVGLEVINGAIYNGTEVVLTMSRAYLFDNSDIEILRDVSEVYDKNTVTITADLSGLTFPVTIDPSLTLNPTNQDTQISEANSTTNYGGHHSMAVVSLTGSKFRSLAEFTGITPVPSAVITSALFRGWYRLKPAVDPVGRTIKCYESTDVWDESIATWDSLSGGGYDVTGGGSMIVPASVDQWLDYSFIDHPQMSSGIPAAINLLFRFEIENTVSNYQLFMRTKEYVVVGQRPYVVIEYIEGVSNVLSFGRGIMRSTSRFFR